MEARGMHGVDSKVEQVPWDRLGHQALFGSFYTTWGDIRAAPRLVPSHSAMSLGRAFWSQCSQGSQAKLFAGLCLFPWDFYCFNCFNQVNTNTTGTESRVTQKLPGPAMLSVCIQLKHCLRELTVAPENEFSTSNPESFLIFSPASPHAECFKRQGDRMMQKKSVWLPQKPGVVLRSVFGDSMGSTPTGDLG